MRGAPLRDVERIIDIEHPKGGVLHVTMFSCGHRLWERRRRVKPTSQRPCVDCYVDAKVDAILEAEADADMIPPGFK